MNMIFVLIAIFSKWKERPRNDDSLKSLETYVIFEYDLYKEEIPLSRTLIMALSHDMALRLSRAQIFRPGSYS